MMAKYYQYLDLYTLKMKTDYFLIRFVSLSSGTLIKPYICIIIASISYNFTSCMI